MRVLAVLVVLALVALPLVACGVSGAINTCQGQCERCDTSDECCHNATCSIFTSDAQGRCQTGNFQCKLTP